MGRWVRRIFLLALAVAALTGAAMAADVITEDKIVLGEVDGGWEVKGYTGKDTEVIIPASYNGKPVVKITATAFANYDRLVNLTIPGEVEQIEDGAFKDKTALTTVTFLDYVEKGTIIPSLTSIGTDGTGAASGAGVFAGCKNLETVTLSGSIGVIGKNAFKGCTELNSMIFPKGISKICDNAFDGCTSLESLVFLGAGTSLGANVFSWGNIKIIHCRTGGIYNEINAKSGKTKEIHTFSQEDYKEELRTAGNVCKDGGTIKASFTCPGSTTVITNDDGSTTTKKTPCAYYKNGEFSQTRSISPLPHTVKVLDAKPATCEQAGLTEGARCIVCGEMIIKQEVIDKLDHTLDGVKKETIVKEATCTEDGVKVITQKCTKCGNDITQEEIKIPANGHMFAEDPQTEVIVKTATCTEKGLKGHRRVCTVEDCKQVEPCPVCDDPKTSEEDLLKHWESFLNPAPATPAAPGAGDAAETTHWAEEYEADKTDLSIHPAGELKEEKRETEIKDCKEGGIRKITYQCQACKEQIVEEEDISPAEHTPAEPDTVVVAATCTTPGKTIRHATTCSVCGMETSKEETVITSAPGHTWGSPEPDPAEKENDKAATCGAPGASHVILRCTVCGEKKAQVLDLPATGEHTWGDWAADANDKGKEIRTCSVCGETETRDISAGPGDSTDDPSSSGDDSSGSSSSGGSSSGGTATTPEPTRYSVNLIQSSNGSVSSSRSTAEAGDRVTLTVWADSGYELDQLRVTASGGSVRNLTGLGDDQYSFSMPASSVEVRATFTRSASSSTWYESSSSRSSSSSRKSDTTPVQTVIQSVPRAAASGQRFPDVPSSHWAAGEINWANQMGYMNGGKNGFDPDGNITFQQLWMVLARLTGSHPASMTDARRWAVNGGFAEGASPTGAVKRHQLVTALYRCAHLMGSTNRNTASLAGYADSRTVPASARDAFAWAVANGIIGGNSNGRLDPNGTLTRAQFSVILYRFSQRI